MCDACGFPAVAPEQLALQNLIWVWKCKLTDAEMLCAYAVQHGMARGQ